MSLIKIKRYVSTSPACPTQFDMWDGEGNYYYLRYRHGVMYILLNEKMIVEGNIDKKNNGRCELKDFIQMASNQGYEFELADATNEGVQYQMYKYETSLGMVVSYDKDKEGAIMSASPSAVMS